MTVFIDDFTSKEPMCFNYNTGELSNVSDSDDVKAAGYGSEMKIRLFKKKKVYVAIYPYDDALILWINGQQFDLRTKTIRVKRRTIPLTCTHCFSIMNGSDILLSFWYTFVTFETWPDDGDIFTYITRVTSTRKEVERSFFVMNAELQGRTIINDPNLEKECDNFVHEQLKE